MNHVIAVVVVSLLWLTVTDEKAHSAFGSEVQQLTFGPGNDTESAWAPDGRSIVFQSDRKGTIGLYLLNLETKAVKPLLEGPGHAEFPAWSPNGKWIVFSRAHFTKTAFEGQEDGYNLFVVPAEGGQPRRLTHGRCRDYSPVFLADNKTIWFSSDRGGKDRMNNAVSLYSVSMEGGEPQMVLRQQGVDRAAVQASFSPDGRSFAYGAIAGFRDNWHIRLAHTAHPDEGFSLSDARGCFYGPRWSPAGSTLACTGFQLKDDAWGVWLIDPMTAQRMRVETGGGNSRSPAWSPDGKSVVWENNRSGVYKLYCKEVPPLPKVNPAVAMGSSLKQVLHYNFAGGAPSSVADLSPLSNAGQVNGAPHWGEKAVSFGPGASISVPKAKGFDFGKGPFTVRAVVRVPEGCKFAMIAMGEYPGNRLGWQLYVGDDRRALFNSRTADLIYRGARSDEPLPAHRPVTLTGVRDADGTVRLYVDGNPQQATNADAFCDYGQPVQVRIGSQYSGAASFPGDIYDIAVYGRALTVEEAQGDSLKLFWSQRVK